MREPADLFEDAAVWQLPPGADPEAGGAGWHQLAVLPTGGSGNGGAAVGEKAGAPDGEKARLKMHV